MPFYFFNLILQFAFYKNSEKFYKNVNRKKTYGTSICVRSCKTFFIFLANQWKNFEILLK